MPIRQMTEQDIKLSIKMIKQGKSKTFVANKMSVTRVTLRKSIKEYEKHGRNAIDTTSKPYPRRANSKNALPVTPKEILKDFHDHNSLWKKALYSKIG